MKKQKSISVLATLLLSSIVALATSHAIYVTTCGKTITGKDQSSFEYYGQWWDYVQDLNRQNCPNTQNQQMLQVNCTLAPDPGDMTVYRIQF